MADDPASTDVDASRAGDLPLLSPKRAKAASVGSLSPPPADGDEVADTTTKAADDKGDNKPSATDGDDWDAYRRQRGVRGFSGAKAAQPPPLQIDSATTENGDTNADADAKDGNHSSDKNKENGESTLVADDDVSTETSASNSVEPGSRSARRRRGEEQLLLDDHLLPKEMRVHPPKREKGASSKRSEPPEDPEPEPEKEEKPATKVAKVEPEEPAEPEAEEEEAGEDEEEEDDSAEITRCVCKREGKCADVDFQNGHS
jgi:hypothetical protein